MLMPLRKSKMLAMLVEALGLEQLVSKVALVGTFEAVTGMHLLVGGVE